MKVSSETEEYSNKSFQCVVWSAVSVTMCFPLYKAFFYRFTAVYMAFIGAFQTFSSDRKCTLKITFMTLMTLKLTRSIYLLVNYLNNPITFHHGVPRFVDKRGTADANYLKLSFHCQEF